MTEYTYLDADPFIGTGVPADPERVAELIADPASSIDASIIDSLPPEQQPTPEQIEAAQAAAEATARGLNLRDYEQLVAAGFSEADLPTADEMPAPTIP